MSFLLTESSIRLIMASRFLDIVGESFSLIFKNNKNPLTLVCINLTKQISAIKNFTPTEYIETGYEMWVAYNCFERLLSSSIVVISTSFIECYYKEESAQSSTTPSPLADDEKQLSIKEMELPSEIPQ